MNHHTQLDCKVLEIYIGPQWGESFQELPGSLGSWRAVLGPQIQDPELGRLNTDHHRPQYSCPLFWTNSFPDQQCLTPLSCELLQ